MPPTTEVSATPQSKIERKVMIRYRDRDGHPREKQMPFAEFQAFCISWYAYENGRRGAVTRSWQTQDKSPEVTR